jgi:hypothetical protein
MILAAFVLGTTTFAWISMTNTAKIDNFNATVGAGEGIEMSLDGTAFHSTLTEEIIHDYLFERVGASYPNFKYKAVTSENGIVLLGYDNQTAVGYLEFDLTFRTPTGETPDVYWAGASVTSIGKPWTPDTSFINAKGISLTPLSGSSTYYVSDACRISVQGDLNTIVFENPEIGTNTVLGEKINNDLSNSNGAVDYYKKKNAGSAPALANSVNVHATVSSDEDLNDLPLLTLHDAAEAGQDLNFNYGKVTIRIWIEGWDPDCFNSVLADVMSVQLVFAKPAE